MSEEREQGGSIMKLTRANYHAWLSQVKDLILSLDHDDAADIWQAFETWDPNTPVINPGRDAAGAVVEDYDYQAAANATDRKLRHLHNKVYRDIRRSLNKDELETTLHLATHVPQLLRHLRNWWHENTIYDRMELTEEYEAMRLGQYSDMQVFITAFKNKVTTLRSYGNVSSCVAIRLCRWRRVRSVSFRKEPAHRLQRPDQSKDCTGNELY